MRRILALTFGLLLAGTPADAKRAFEIADLYRVAGVGVPEISRDGSRVAFSVNRYDLPAGESWSEIWMMAPDGSGLRQMTFGRHGDSTPSFSPDGKTLLFVSDQSGESQLHLLPIDGGESRQLTHFPLGVSDPVWSPKGRYIAVTSRVFPECGADAKCNEKLLKDSTEGKLKVRVADALLYRHWTEWREGRYSHILLVDAATGDVVKDLTPGPWDSPVFIAGGGRGFDLSPDGKQLVYASNHDKDPASSTNADLWAVDVEGKVSETSAVNLTDANDGWDGSPLFSPDGRYIAFRSQETPRYESALFRLAVYDRQAKKTRYLTDRSNFDNWVDDMAWFPDSQSLLFQGEVKGRTPLYRIGLVRDAPKNGPFEVLTHGLLEGFRVMPDGRSIIYTQRAIAEPYEVYSALVTWVGNGGPHRLTRFNGPLETDVDIRPAEEIWVDAGPYKVHVFVIKPHGFDPSKKYPLILNVHGGPQSQYGDSFRGDWQVYPGKGYVVAFANPTGSTGYGQEFTDAIACDWGGRVYQDLMKVTDTLEKLPYVDKDRMGAMGWSFGGYMMMWFEGHTQRFKAIASMMGLFDLPSFYTGTEELWFPEKDLCGPPWASEAYAEWSPSNFVPNFKTPALVLTGENDLRVPYTQSLGFFTALQKQSVPSRLVVYPEAGHWPGWKEMAFYYNAHLDWFHKWLGGEPAPYNIDELARNRAFGKEGGWTKP
ncbi:MAG TPA: S9 family peptidase [Thermoanaerobaculia bacterium]|jgi:dipeptidyl aminopeptidase/acylaminoacyl peptidase|nr:S9 family peptidase [Thermoanaerobaculia bacterium]